MELCIELGVLSLSLNSKRHINDAKSLQPPRLTSYSNNLCKVEFLESVSHRKAVQ